MKNTFERKIIGLTGADIVYNGDVESPLLVAREKYFQVIAEAGGTPILTNNISTPEIISHFVGIIDGLLLTGGGDIHPRYYHQERHQLTGKFDMTVDTQRDETELALIREALRQNKPILGICRGCQVINVALGGTIMQDINSIAHPKNERHLIPNEEGGWYVEAHSVKIAPDTKLRKIFQADEMMVNSAHHQAVDKVGRELKVAATSPALIIESIEHKSKFIVGVQWHPEQMENDYPHRLFEAFISACKHSYA